MFTFFIYNKYIKSKIFSNVSIGKNASHMVFAQYLETEFRDLRLVLSRWTTYSNNNVDISNCKVDLQSIKRTLESIHIAPFKTTTAMTCTQTRAREYTHTHTRCTTLSG